MHSHGPLPPVLSQDQANATATLALLVLIMIARLTSATTIRELLKTNKVYCPRVLESTGMPGPYFEVAGGRRGLGRNDCDV